MVLCFKFKTVRWRLCCWASIVILGAQQLCFVICVEKLGELLKGILFGLR